MKDLFLVKLSKEYQKSFEEYVLAYKSINDDYYFNKYKNGLEDFNGYLADLRIASTEITPEYEVVTSVFWLINKSDVVGVVRVRHEEIDTAGHIGYDISPKFRGKGFGTSILKLALVEAKKIGIKEAIVTCNKDNEYSRKIIEKNHGILLGNIYDEEENEHLYKYSIDLESIGI